MFGNHLRGICFVPVAALLLFSMGCGYGSKVDHGNIEVYYTDGATKEEADRLGAYLLKTWQSPADRRSVQIRKAGDGYQFRMVVKKEFQNDERTLKSLELEGARISRDVFNGAAVEAHACDERLKTLKTFPPRADIRYGLVDGKLEVFFADSGDKADAERLAKHLIRESDKQAPQVTFKLAKRDSVVEVHMVVQPEAIKNPAIIAGWRQARNDLATNVFKNAVVELHLCDEFLNVLQVLKP